jgi:predicted RNA binding protein YcfA (HicA-like mRNA interferase family)
MLLYLCGVKIQGTMKRYKVRDILKMLEKDGWFFVAQDGSHRQFKHPTKKGRVTVNGKPGDTLSQELLNSISKQAGWR